MSKNNRVLTYLINLSFYLYFIILLVERVVSVSLSFANGINIYGNAFDGYVYALVFLSIVGWLVFLLLKCRDSLKALFIFNENINFNYLCFASGILLLSGMVHTHYTISVVQFISYGILIVGILLKVIMNKGNALLKWLSFSYLVSFSMAIPVMYQSLIEAHVYFHIIEGVASFILVGVFTYLLLLLFNERDDLFISWAIFAAIFFDVTLIIMRWEEEINVFVLIFISLSFVLFLAGTVVKVLNKKKSC